LSARGWDYTMVQTINVLGAGNSLATAAQQLTGIIPEDYTYTTNAPNGVQLQQWNNDTATPRDVPGLSGVPGSPVPLDNIVTVSLGYMHLTAGAHRFTVTSDDGFQLQSGTTPSDPAATVIGFRDGGTFNGGFFDFLVEAEGLYPVRCLWYEHTGSADFTLSSVNLSDNSQVLINDPANPTGVVQVYLPDAAEVILLSSATPVPASGYTIEGGAVVDTVGKTVTVAQSGSARYYRLSSTGPTQLKITQTKKVGSNIVMTYQ
jgi:hypothetical protein